MHGVRFNESIMKQNAVIPFVVLLIMLGCKDNNNTSDAFGNFEATATTISAETSGKLLWINAVEGEELKAGVAVAQVDTTQLHLQKQKVRASISALSEKLLDTVDDIEVLQRRKANLERERDRTVRLLEDGAATPKQLDDITGEIEVIDRQVEALRSQTKTGNRAILAEREPLLAQIEIVNDQIRRSAIYNPVDGTVLTRTAEPHEVVATGSPLYRIANLDTMTLRFYVDALQYQELGLGLEIEVLIDSGTEGYTGMTGIITWISDEAEFTPRTIQTKKDRVNLVYAVKAKVANKDGILKIGMPAEVNFN